MDQMEIIGDPVYKKPSDRVCRIDKLSSRLVYDWNCQHYSRLLFTLLYFTCLNSLPDFFPGAFLFYTREVI